MKDEWACKPGSNCCALCSMFSCDCRESNMLQEIKRLRERELFLDCLEALGVDNWDPGYSDAHRMVRNINEGRDPNEGIS